MVGLRENSIYRGVAKTSREYENQVELLPYDAIEQSCANTCSPALYSDRRRSAIPPRRPPSFS